jgi:hypothetical protein
MNILLFFLLLWFTRLEDWRDGNLRFHSTEPLPSPSLSLKFLSVQIARRRLLSRRSPVVRRPALPAPADPLQLSLSDIFPLSSARSARFGRPSSGAASRSSRSSPSLSLSGASRSARFGRPSSALPAPADSLQLSLSPAVFLSLALPASPDSVALLFAVLSRRPASSVVRQISSQSSSVSGRSSLRQVLSFFFVSAFFVFELHVMFEILNV